MRFRGDGIGHLDPRTRNTRGSHVDESERTRIAQLDAGEAEGTAVQEANLAIAATDDEGDGSERSLSSGSETDSETGTENDEDEGEGESDDEYERGGVDGIFLDV